MAQLARHVLPDPQWRRRRLALALVLGGLVAAAGGARAQTAASPPAPYRPGLGDLMTMTVQPRHIKLGLAGRQANWPYASYELHELEEAFERAARAWPEWRKVPVAGMIDSLTKPPIADLAQAIKAADAAGFTAAYGRLTAACNACHQAADRGVIVIRVPDAGGFPDQDFAPAKP